MGAKTGTLLILDDSPINRTAIRKSMEESGEFSRYFEAKDGVVGLKILSEVGNGVDVVVSDINMPVMDGYKFLRAVRVTLGLQHLPVVMVTSETEVEDVVKAFELGANDYIAKPFVPAILKARLKNMLNMKQLQDQLKIQKDLMEKLATTDPLTEIANVRYFRKWLDHELGRSHRYKVPMALIMFDIDHFKSINDTYGHPQGDAVLKELARIVQGSLRRVDLQARYGGEEFVVALPQTPPEGAALAAERLRTWVEEHRFPGLPEGARVTISLGLAFSTGERRMDVQELIDEADQALYRAKNKGRNRVEHARPVAEAAALAKA